MKKTIHWSRIFEKDHPWEHTKMPKKTIRLVYRPVVQMMEQHTFDGGNKSLTLWILFYLKF